MSRRFPRRPVEWAAVCWTALVAVLLVLPPSGGSWLGLRHEDKAAHAAAFFGLGVLWVRALRIPRVVLWVTAGGILFGALSELGQALLPWVRKPEVFDVVADAIGVTVGVLVGSIGLGRRTFAEHRTPGNIR